MCAAMLVPAGLSAQAQDQTSPVITVVGTPPADISTLPAGPDVKGIIVARSDNKIKVTSADGSSTVIGLTDLTKVKASGGLFGGKGKFTVDSLLNGLPVTVKTRQAPDGLWASQVSFKAGDHKTAMMIQQGTAQGFAEQSAQTEALRSRMGDIDKYNIKSTTNVYFDTGKWVLSPMAKNELCAAAAQAEQNENALLLVVGYTDSVGSEEYNQMLSEKRAGAVINYLQQACRWKPYRMLTPTGMAESDPLADNETPEGRAQNRRVSVNVLVSKSLDGM
ncbi:MAG: OmpA family protein [Sphingomonadaceae bacterium]|nr:OmpA family protein [Sphingomonadaceae bacterium]